MAINSDANKKLKGRMTAIVRTHEDADAKGLMRGHGGHSSIICPICGGTLNYNVAGVNGHIWGRCETKGCISWME